MSSNQTLMFLQKFVEDPKYVGSIIPSSRFLSRKMVNSVAWQDVRTIAELGSGTGAITQVIQSRVLESAKVILFEKDELMNRRLKELYPYYSCYSNACDLRKVMQKEEIAHFDCIISGLPFFNFPEDMRNALVNQIWDTLKPGGIFVAFQYSLQMKKHLSDIFYIESIKFVPLNFPPAFVYVCRKKEDN
ncbi:methyltransferase domain-containing protein [Paenibacillus sp. LMG 31460]|uniref:Methyltransferase domain-containing protein n=1 Tax=Paenibacillus germinis TaxID=2654979 RepID=A0ABX1YZH5_9BACL|nr:methyltransferase domain-containing protein [Paenibacillus germinis]NOU86352.1 methyltransferase domain-containing protein [Paenibacillus germinis]